VRRLQCRRNVTPDNERPDDGCNHDTHPLSTRDHAKTVSLLPPPLLHTHLATPTYLHGHVRRLLR
jgi:hypothetical protein